MTPPFESFNTRNELHEWPGGVEIPFTSSVGMVNKPVDLCLPPEQMSVDQSFYPGVMPTNQIETYPFQLPCDTLTSATLQPSIQNDPSSASAVEQSNGSTADDGPYHQNSEYHHEQHASPRSAATKKQTYADTAEDEKRQQLLERNRQAAFKCRQRKKEWIAQLQGNVDLLTAENIMLKEHVIRFREEIICLKTLLLAHDDCPLTQASRTGIRYSI
ncbi:hypothetical protein EC973_003544 [Apophysomyces ossiformis]|uniref:BZIP domain-containing protein n=1 Tax=Apophysomyces ossiformis TaxID=679940 RepID=A0A8H7EQI3_9FUNG|nr:hypothetical protein EC973_003544 [Apophysomyces ossiformis]